MYIDTYIYDSLVCLGERGPYQTKGRTQHVEPQILDSSTPKVDLDLSDIYTSI